MATMPVTTQKRSRSSLFVIKVKSVMKLVVIWLSYSHCFRVIRVGVLIVWPFPNHRSNIWFLLMK